jgi:membrane-associated protein
MDFIINIDLSLLIQTIGYLGIFIIIFAESGLFFGFFLPGDSLLFTAGLLASQGYFNIIWLILLTTIGAIAGDQIGYFFGKKVGPKIFNRDDSFFFKKKYIHDAEVFYQKHGKKAIVLARFMPIIRTFIPILAGVGSMHYKTFIIYNVLGGLIWAAGITLLGYFLGENIPNIDEYLIPILLLIIFVSVLHTILSFILHKNKDQ